jgi:hypothetical protein
MHNGHEKDGTGKNESSSRVPLSPPDEESAKGEGPLDAPPKLLAALRQLPKEPIFVPRTIDEALLKAAREHLSPPQKKSFRWLRLMPWSVATAGLAAAVLLAYPHAKDFLGSGRATFERSSRSFQHPSKIAGPTEIDSPTHVPAYAREDLNHDGNVDILDAFELARKLQSPPFANPTLDINGDGIIDHRDVEVIASHAVSLEKRGRS